MRTHEDGDADGSDGGDGSDGSDGSDGGGGGGDDDGADDGGGGGDGGGDDDDYLCNADQHLCASKGICSSCSLFTNSKDVSSRVTCDVSLALCACRMHNTRGMRWVLCWKPCNTWAAVKYTGQDHTRAEATPRLQLCRW